MPADDPSWTQIDALLAEALEWPEAEREARLSAATVGRPGLFREVSALLATHQAAERRLGESVLDLLVGDEPEEPSLAAGTLAGPYRIIRELGRGGMGTVYLARRADDAFEREVAIKVVRTGLDAGSVTRRFAAERRILARLEHPNIARLYDSVATAGGSPSLVMEYVPGSRIDEHADAKRLGIPDRLRLFLAACDGVSYAHRQMVVHRDLKPANVRVTDNGEVKLLDFGIARLLDPGDDEDPITRPGFRPVTPEYAPPEQLRGDPVTASVDVYALGVMLHELLVGVRPPWQRRILEHAAPADVEGDLVPPSRTASQGRAGKKSATELAAARQLTPAGLRGALEGDLDAIVLTALAPDAARRYPSVEALRADVARYLEGQPIEARPPSRSYRIGKFVHRHRAVVTAAAAAILLAVAYLVNVSLVSSRLAAERTRAERERDRADQVVRVLTDLLGAADPFSPGQTDTMRVADLLGRSGDRVQRELAGQPLVLAKVLGALGSVQRQLGRFDEAAPLLEQAVELLRASPGSAPADLAGGLADLGLLRRSTARLPEADSLLREALALVTAPRSGDLARVAQIEGHLASVLVDRGHFDSAAAIFDTAIARVRQLEPLDTLTVAELLGNRGAAAQRRGDRATALAFIREAHTLRRAALGEDHPTTLLDLGNLGFLTDRMGAPPDAVPILERAADGLGRKLGEAHPMAVAVRRNLAGALSRSGRLPEAIALLEAIVAVERRRARGSHLDLGIALDYLAGMYDQAGRYADAERAFGENHAVFRDVVGPGHFNTALALGRHAWARCRPGVEVTPGRIQEALADFERALGVIDSVLPPANNQRIGRRVMYGSCLSRAGRHPDAEGELLRQLALARAAFAPGDPILRFSIGEVAGHYARTSQSDRAAWARALADTLAPPASRR